MKRTPITSIVLALTLMNAVGVSHAADDDERKAREDRRALKLNQYDDVSVSEAYRQAAREKRHESIAFLTALPSLRQRAADGSGCMWPLMKIGITGIRLFGSRKWSGTITE